MPPQRKRQRDDDDADAPRLEFVVAGCGAGATAVYDGATSSTFLLRLRSRGGTAATTTTTPRTTTTTTAATTTTPLLVVDLGFGAQRALSALCGDDGGRAFPAQAPIFISHNHSDHAAELPVVASVERLRRAAPWPLVVLAEAGVARTLGAHRLDELRSTGLVLEDFVDLRELEADGGRVHPLPLPLPAGGGVGWVAGAVAAGAAAPAPLAAAAAAPEWELGLSLVRAAHSERCFGFLLMGRRRGGAATNAPWTPLLGWSADSAADARVYQTLARAPLVVLDARAGLGTREHAGVGEVVEMSRGSGPLAAARRVVVYGYGGEAEWAMAEADLAGVLAAFSALAATRRGGGGASAGHRRQSPSIEIASPGLVLEVPLPPLGREL